MSEKREFPILNGKLLSDLDANGHKIIGGDIEVPPEKIKEVVAPDLEAKADKREVSNAITAINTSLDGKADKTALEDEVARAQDAETALGEEIDKKVDAVEGKGLSTNDYTNEEKAKLEGVEAGAQKNPDLSGYAKTADVEAALEKSEEAIAEAQNAAGAVSNLSESLATLMPRYPLRVQPQITYNESDGSTNLILYSYANNKYVPSEGEIIHIHVAYSDKDQNSTYHKNDIELVVDCTNLTEAPKLKWWGVGVTLSIFRPRTDAETDFACVAGVRNVYWISEYAVGEFVVAGWQETEGGSAV